uniref:Uncharacterized protein n=1 Tax=Spongospora subterranea TaxID=70186 RepID=A0A0H5QL69_9EUKA|eukprot:CRZ02865.1 hypothetical protein [Spongospora subterranea]
MFIVAVSLRGVPLKTFGIRLCRFRIDYELGEWSGGYIHVVADICNNRRAWRNHRLSAAFSQPRSQSIRFVLHRSDIPNPCQYPRNRQLSTIFYRLFRWKRSINVIQFFAVLSRVEHQQKSESVAEIVINGIFACAFQWLLASVGTGIVFFDEIAGITRFESAMFTVGLMSVMLGVSLLSQVHLHDDNVRISIKI